MAHTPVPSLLGHSNGQQSMHCWADKTNTANPVMVWLGDGCSPESTGAPHLLFLGATQAPGTNPDDEEATSQPAEHLWCVPSHRGAGDRVDCQEDYGWTFLVWFWWGSPGRQGLCGVDFPFIFTSALDQNKRSSQSKLFVASRLGNVRTSSMGFSLRATGRHSLGWSELCNTHLVCTTSWPNRQQDRPCRAHSTQLPFSVKFISK